MGSEEAFKRLIRNTWDNGRMAARGCGCCEDSVEHQEREWDEWWAVVQTTVEALDV
jgi:hypothetical protein